MSSTQSRHLKTQLDELQRRYGTLTKRIVALDTDIGRELDSERKLVLQERRGDLAAERDQVLAEMAEIELQLGGGQETVRPAEADGADRESRQSRTAPKVIGTDPPRDAADMPRDLTTIRIQFDRPMAPNGRSLSQKGGFGLGNPAVHYDPGSYTFSFTRDNPGLLPANTTITFTVNPDMPPGTGFVDLDGNRAEMCAFSFTTGAKPKPSRRREPVEPVSADLQLLVTLAPDGRTLSYTLNTPGGDYNFLQLGSVTLQASPREMLQRTFDRLSTLAHLSPEKRTPAQTQQALRDLTDIGSNLYDELLPDAFKTEYCTLREKYLGGNLWLTSNEPWIPWEIVRPVAYDRQGVPLYDDAPLCESFRLARWVSGPAAPARLALQRALVVRPSASLKATSAETSYFAGLPGAVPGLTVAEPLETVSETLEAFSAGQVQLYHFACHGNFDLTDPNESKLKLTDGFLTPNQLTGDRRSGLLSSRPLVFVNACHAGERGFGLTQLGGWAERFIGAGASTFIGSLWQINDKLAARFALEFYNRLFGLNGHVRQPLGQAFREARLMLKELDPANPTWLAYVLYGNPHAEVSLTTEEFGEQSPSAANAEQKTTKDKTPRDQKRQPTKPARSADTTGAQPTPRVWPRILLVVLGVMVVFAIIWGISRSLRTRPIDGDSARFTATAEALLAGAALSVTPTYTSTPSSTWTPTLSPTATWSPTPAPSAGATNTRALTSTYTVTPLPTLTRTVTSTPRPSSTFTPLPTLTRTATSTPKPSSTFTPGPTHTPTAPSKPQAMIKVSYRVNLRSGPGTAYPSIGSAEANTSFEIVGKNAETPTWWQVCCVMGRKVWIAAYLVTANGPLEMVPIVAVPPPPTPTPSPTSPPSPTPTDVPTPPPDTPRPPTEVPTPTLTTPPPTVEPTPSFTPATP